MRIISPSVNRKVTCERTEYLLIYCSFRADCRLDQCSPFLCPRAPQVSTFLGGVTRHSHGCSDNISRSGAGAGPHRMSHAEGGSFYSDWQIFPIASIVSLRLLVWVFTDYVAGAGGLGLHVSRVTCCYRATCRVTNTSQ